MKAMLIQPGGDVSNIELPGTHDWPAFSAAAREHLKIGDDMLELVAVIFDGKPATLLISEVGASKDTDINPRGQLPANARATAMYWTATIKGITPVPFNPLTMPMIHGAAILLEVDKRRL